MNGQTEKINHEFYVKMRKEMSVSGVKEVESFDENGVILHTFGGEMSIEGREIHIDVLDMERGVVSLSGRIDAVFYSTEDEKEKNGFFGKLFR